jgi:YT521-B-like domain
MEELPKRAEEAIDPRRWTVVCKHWLKGLCQKDEKCEYLHQYDLSRMPVCSSITKGKVCTLEDCVFKHTDPNMKRCPRYDLGFCIKGPQCKEKHERALKQPDYLPDKYFSEIINPMFHSVVPLKTDHIFLQRQVPFQGSTRYFIACGDKSLIKLSMAYFAWSVMKKDLKVIREGLRQCGNVALIFRDDSYFYGFAKIVTDCDPSLHPNLFGNNPNLSSNFHIKWMKKCKLDSSLTNAFRNPFDGMARIRLSKDSQEVETEVAEKLCELLMQQPDYPDSEYSRKKRKRSADHTDKLILKKNKINSDQVQ